MRELKAFSPEAHVVSPYRKSAESMRQYVGKMSTGDAKLFFAWVISRNAHFVFGERLARQAEDNMLLLSRFIPTKSESERGEYVLRQRYAATLGRITTALGWEEDKSDSSLQLLSGYLYEDAIVKTRDYLRENGDDTGELDNLSFSLTRAIDAFVIEKRIEEDQKKTVLLLRRLFSEKLTPTLRARYEKQLGVDTRQSAC